MYALTDNAKICFKEFRQWIFQDNPLIILKETGIMVSLNHEYSLPLHL
jgi:hypothetical protein